MRFAPPPPRPTLSLTVMLIPSRAVGEGREEKKNPSMSSRPPRVGGDSVCARNAVLSAAKMERPLHYPVCTKRC